MNKLVISLFLCCFPLFGMSGVEHLSLWEAVSTLPTSQGGLGNELSKVDRKLLHKFVDLRYDHSPIEKRNLPSHNARLMGKIFKDYWKPSAVRNAVALHAVADMFNSHRKGTGVGVNGHAYSIKKGKEAERVITAIRQGKSVRYPKWALKEGGKFKYDKAVISALKEQAHQIIWLKKINSILKVTPYIYYSAQAGRICYLYGIDKKIGEEEALYFLSGVLSGGAIFHSTTALLSMGGSTIASMGVGGAIVMFVLPAALSTMGIIALEKYLRSERVDSFEDLADLIGELPPFLRELYDTGSKDTRKNMRDLYRGFRSLKKESDKIVKKVADGFEQFNETTEQFIEGGSELMEEFGDQIEKLTREVERVIP